MAFQMIPFLMAASTAVTIMGQRQQMKQIKANAAWNKYENELSFQYEKQKKLKEQAKLMSAQRARVGASGAQFSGSPLLIANADFEEFENDMLFLEKRVFVRNAAMDAETTGLLTAQKYKMGETLLSAGMTYKNYQQDQAAAKKGIG
jgi:hypothetical protein